MEWLFDCSRRNCFKNSLVTLQVFDFEQNFLFDGYLIDVPFRRDGAGVTES
ncbi:MAG: hypothetical protein LBE30_11255 [Comamonas sp.]|jgi:hypothetical protein|nr:hypothetical protein [Comamonas sp.]